ncbi:uncharacterized protein A4U43_C06F8570 [Asparagus officinalis]|uniref:Uncharacterized protein n=1 Tax=Asparagus officinalis TaxID=4686 RepID=A0A5P1EKP8_ASPOF|nr:uncharacterized protein A4U43_C06F8570 [Asparagus officinalis]
MAEIYEARRRKTIDENIERMRALGISPLSQTISRTLPMHERKSKGNKKKVCEDDDDYQPPMDDKLVLYSYVGHKLDNFILTGSVPSARINVRGATRGKGIERLVRQLGRAIPVPIPSSSGAPEGEHATSLANEIGKEIRSSALVRNCGWDNIDAGSREAIIMRVRHGSLECFNFYARRIQTKSYKAKVSRSKLHYNHISGSRSFAAAMSLIERLVNKTIEQSQPEVTSPMNEFEISIDVLGRRPGYLKGYGIHLRGSSSTRSIAKSAERDAEVVVLKETVAVQTEQIASQAEQIASQAEQLNAQAQKTADLEALVHQLFARSQPGASSDNRDFSSR